MESDTLNETPVSIFPPEIELRVFNSLLHNVQRKSAFTFLRLSKTHRERYAPRCWHTVFVTRSTGDALVPVLLGHHGTQYLPLIERIVFGTLPSPRLWRELRTTTSEKYEDFRFEVPNVRQVVITRACVSELILDAACHSLLCFGIEVKGCGEISSPIAKIIGLLLSSDLDVCFDSQESISLDSFLREHEDYRFSNRISSLIRRHEIAQESYLRSGMISWSFPGRLQVDRLTIHNSGFRDRPIRVRGNILRLYLDPSDTYPRLRSILDNRLGHHESSFERLIVGAPGIVDDDHFQKQWKFLWEDHRQHTRPRPDRDIWPFVDVKPVIPELDFENWRDAILRQVTTEDGVEREECPCGYHPFGGRVDDRIWEDDLHDLP